MKHDAKKAQSGKRNRPVPAKAGKAPGRQPISSGDDGGEPTVARNGAPMWLIILGGLLFYWGQIYLDQNAAGFDGRVYEPFESFAQLDARQPKDESQLMLARGKLVYEQACQLCHQSTGLGLPGQFPPLAGSEWVNTPGAGRMARIVLHGAAGEIMVNGQKWNAAMPGGIGDALPEADFAALLTYVRQAWGNNAPVVKVEHVRAVKEATAGRTLPWTAGELMAIPETE